MVNWPIIQKLKRKLTVYAQRPKQDMLGNTNLLECGPTATDFDFSQNPIWNLPFGFVNR